MPILLRDCDTATDYAAFMLAMVVARHSVTSENANQQWSAEMLAENNNIMAFADSPN